MTARVKDLIVQRDGINKATEEDEWIQKQIKTLENKLDKVRNELFLSLL